MTTSHDVSDRQLPRGAGDGADVPPIPAASVILLRDSPLQVRDLSVRRIENLLSLQNVKLCGHAMIDANLGELHRVFLRRDGLARDLELRVKLQEREIVTGHVAQERQYDRLPRILCCKELGASRLICATQPTEEVQLKRCVGRKEQKVRFSLEVMFFSATKVAVPLDLREKIGTCYGNLRASAVNALRGKLQVIILL